MSEDIYWALITVGNMCQKCINEVERQRKVAMGLWTKLAVKKETPAKREVKKESPDNSDAEGGW